MAVEAAAYFVTSEALADVARYAAASQAWVGVAERAGELEVTIRDDGCGGARSAPIRLQGLRDRVSAMNGTLEIDSPPGAGTTVCARLPSR